MGWCMEVGFWRSLGDLIVLVRRPPAGYRLHRGLDDAEWRAGPSFIFLIPISHVPFDVVVLRSLHAVVGVVRHQGQMESRGERGS